MDVTGPCNLVLLAARYLRVSWGEDIIVLFVTYKLIVIGFIGPACLYRRVFYLSNSKPLKRNDQRECSCKRQKDGANIKPDLRRALFAQWKGICEAFPFTGVCSRPGK